MASLLGRFGIAAGLVLMVGHGGPGLRHVRAAGTVLEQRVGIGLDNDPGHSRYRGRRVQRLPDRRVVVSCRARTTRLSTTSARRFSARGWCPPGESNPHTLTGTGF